MNKKIELEKDLFTVRKMRNAMKERASSNVVSDEERLNASKVAGELNYHCRDLDQKRRNCKD